MPELPEVETVRRGLEPALVGARLRRVEARRPDLRFPFPLGFVQRLTGARVERLERRGKYLLGPLDRGDTLIVHLGMTGRFEIEGGAERAPRRFRPGRRGRPQTRARRIPHRSRRDDHLFRRATVRLHGPDRHSDALDAHPPFLGMGPEPLGDAFTADYLASASSKGGDSGAKTLLLDQRHRGGPGQHLCLRGALSRPDIARSAPADEISRRQAGRSGRRVRSVLEEAIEAGGSTLRDYASPDGELGYFQHRFDVYGRQGEACARRGCGGVIRADRSGRTIHLLLPKLPEMRAGRAVGVRRGGLPRSWRMARACAQPPGVDRPWPALDTLSVRIGASASLGIRLGAPALVAALARADEVWFEIPIDEATNLDAARLAQAALAPFPPATGSSPT